MSVFTALFQHAHHAHHAHPGSAALAASAVAAGRRDPPVDSGAGTAPIARAVVGGRFRVFDAPSGDVPGGPTHQPGVMPGPSYEPLRTPFGQTGTPGDGRERNPTDLDLAANQHPDGYPFADADGRGTHHAPRLPRRG